MSAQAGIFRFDGQPVPRETIAALDETLKRSGGDSQGVLPIDNGPVLVFRGFHITAEDRVEQQPHVSSSGVALTWDGRLDNRDDLLMQIGLNLPKHATDATIVAGCYERWGQDAFERLIGDWSVALWDPSVRALLLASDYMGPRPLYYHLDSHQVMWSNCLETFIRLLNCQDDLDERYIAGFLMADLPANRTPYRNVLSVPAAHYLQIDSRGRCHQRRYWDYQVGVIRYKSDADYEEHMRHVFRESIRSRLRASGSVWAELSGGWDSSAIVCMAHDVIGASSDRLAGLETISYVSNAPEEAAETRFLGDVEGQCGLAGHHLNGDRFHHSPVVSTLTPAAMRPLWLAMRQVVHDAGGRIIMTGRIGDAVMGSFMDYSLSLADPLAAGHIGEYFRMAREWALATRKPLVSILPQSIPPLLPWSLQERRRRRQVIRKRMGRQMTWRPSLETVYLLDSAYVPHAQAVIHDRPRPPQVSPPSKQDLVQMLDMSGATRRFVYPPLTPHLEYTHPYIDRRLVAFVLAIPTDAWCRPGEPRSLMRRAFAGFMPPSIVRRISKTSGEPSLIRSLRATISSWVERSSDLEVVRHGFVSSPLLASRVKSALAGASSPGNLVSIMRLEAWLRRRQEEKERGELQSDLVADTGASNPGRVDHQRAPTVFAETT